MENNSLKARNYGIDLLRIICMLMIVMLHLLGPGGILGKSPFLSLKYEVLWFVEIGCFCAINCFALISGYVGCCAKHHYINLLLLWLTVVFYTVLITAIFQILLPQSVTMQTWLNAFFPVITYQYWYFTAYFVLFLTMPFLNTILQKCSKKELDTTLMLLFFAFCILAILFQRDSFMLGNGYSAWWLIFLYLVGGYFRKYQLLHKLKVRTCLWGYLGMVFITWFVKLSMELFCLHVLHTNRYNSYLFKYTSPTIVIASILLLSVFERLKLSHKIIKYIQIFIPLVFSVYLIHVHPLIWKNIWIQYFSSLANLPLPLILLCIFSIMFAVFLGCCCLDFIRKKIFEYLDIKQKLLNSKERFVTYLGSNKK